MKKVIALTCVAIIGISAFQILAMGDAFIEFIVLGRIPGTDIDLSIYVILALSLLFIPVIGSWFATFNDQLIASKLQSIQKESVTSYESQVAEKKIEAATTIAQQLEIDELDAITL